MARYVNGRQFSLSISIWGSTEGQRQLTWLNAPLPLTTYSFIILLPGFVYRPTLHTSTILEFYFKAYYIDRKLVKGGMTNRRESRIVNKSWPRALAYPGGRKAGGGVMGGASDPGRRSGGWSPLNSNLVLFSEPPRRLLRLGVKVFTSSPTPLILATSSAKPPTALQLVEAPSSRTQPSPYVYTRPFQEGKSTSRSGHMGGIAPRDTTVIRSMPSARWGERGRRHMNE